MTLEEAIVCLRKQLAARLGISIYRLGSCNLSAVMQQGDTIAHSIQLGIEALQYISDYCEDAPLLHSETKERWVE